MLLQSPQKKVTLAERLLIIVLINTVLIIIKKHPLENKVQPTTICPSKMK